MTVVFFISGHGFGHASREVEIIHALAARRPDVRIVIRSAVSPSLLHRTLKVPFELRPGPCDTGIVQASSVSHDDDATVCEAIAFYERFDERIVDEVQGLAHDEVALIVSDAAPMGCEVASRLAVPGVVISNFTWDWIYETHPGMSAAAPWIVPRIRRAYELATQALELPFAGGLEIFTKITRLPLVARRPTRSREETRAYFGIAPGKPAALLSFGGYGLPDLDLTAIDARGEWTFVTTDRSSSGGPANIDDVVYVEERAFIDSGFRYEDLVAAVEAVVTKPGYGIIAECIVSGTAMLYTSRGDFREYDLLVREMPRFLRSRFISQPDLFAGAFRSGLNALLAQPAPPEHMAADGADVAAGILSSLLPAPGASTSA
jgi:L-arabinokinase